MRFLFAWLVAATAGSYYLARNREMIKAGKPAGFARLVEAVGVGIRK